MPGPTSRLPGVSAAAVVEAEAALVDAVVRVSVVPEMVAPARDTGGAVEVPRVDEATDCGTVTK